MEMELYLLELQYLTFLVDEVSLLPAYETEMIQLSKSEIVENFQLTFKHMHFSVWNGW